MTNIPKPPSITEVGLKHHLDETAESHNNYGYEDFVKMVEAGLDKTNLARAFNVNRNTIYKWLEIHGKEQADGKSN